MKLKEKLLENKNKLVVGGTSVALALGSTLPAFAEVAEGGASANTVATSMQTAFTAIQSDFMGVVAVVGPIALTIYGVFVVWRLGKRFFGNLSGGRN